jgi:hypothetical protein
MLASGMRILAVVAVFLLAGCGSFPETVPSVPRDDSGLMNALNARLQSELKRVSIASESKLPPAGKCTVTDLVVTPTSDSYILAWSYLNPGDYDQNGEVNAADLSAIARNFGKRNTDEGWAIASLADGDANGEVNISDVSTIAANYKNTVGGYGIFCEVGDGDGNGEISISDLSPMGALVSGRGGTAARIGIVGEFLDYGAIVEPYSPGLPGPYGADSMAATGSGDASAGVRRFAVELGHPELKDFLVGVAPVMPQGGQDVPVAIGPLTTAKLPGHTAP